LVKAPKKVITRKHKFQNTKITPNIKKPSLLKDTDKLLIGILAQKGL
jgi:hypothetical protein